jgi:hypothetical protein
MSNSAYATIQDVITLSGKMYTAEEQERIGALLPLVSDALRYEAMKVGRNLDQMIEAETTGAYANVVKLVTVDIVVRVMRQSMEGEPMSQESQSGLGYTWSGTYAIAGGGIAAAILRNDLKRLGLRVQRYGMEAMYGRYPRDNGDTV